MQLLRTALLFAACAATPVLALDAELLKYVGSDATAVAGVYVDRTLSSPLGVYLQSMNGSENRDFKTFIELTGFDPRRDLREIVFASPGGSRQKSGIVVARGAFNVSQLGTVTVQSNRGVKESYAGVDVYHAAEGKGPWFAFPEPSIALLGDEALLKAALDRRSNASGLEARLLAKAQAASARYDVWFASTGQRGVGFGRGKLSAESVDLASGGLTLGATIQLNAEAVMRTEKDAQSLVDTIRFVSSLMQMQGQRNAEINALTTLAQSAQTSVDGATVSISASIPQADVERMLNRSKRIAAIR